MRSVHIPTAYSSWSDLVSSICANVRCSLLSPDLAVFMTLLIIFIRQTQKTTFLQSYNEETFATKQSYIRQEVASPCLKKKAAETHHDVQEVTGRTKTTGTSSSCQLQA